MLLALRAKAAASGESGLIVRAASNMARRWAEMVEERSARG